MAPAVQSRYEPALTGIFSVFAGIFDKGGLERDVKRAVSSSPPRGSTPTGPGPESQNYRPTAMSSPPVSEGGFLCKANVSKLLRANERENRTGRIAVTQV